MLMKLYPTHLEMPEDLDPEEAQEYIQTIKFVYGGSPWWWGDLIKTVVSKNIATYEQIAEMFGGEYSPKSLRNMVHVVSRIPPEWRRPEVVFGKCSTIASCKDLDDRLYWLEVAAHFTEWTVGDFRKVFKALSKLPVEDRNSILLQTGNVEEIEALALKSVDVEPLPERASLPRKPVVYDIPEVDTEQAYVRIPPEWRGRKVRITVELIEWSTAPR